MLEVWNGLSATRQDLSHQKGPDYSDYMAIVQAMQETQACLLDLQQNLDEAPNIPAMIDRLAAQATSLKLDIENMTPPEDLTKQFADLRKAVVLLDIRPALAKLEVAFGSVENKITQQEIENSAAQRALDSSVAGIRSEMRNGLATARKDFEAKISAQNVEIQRLQRLVSMVNDSSRM